MSTRDEYFIDLKVEQGKGLTSIQAMVSVMERLKRERKEVTAAYKQGLITEESYAKSLTRIQVGLKGLSSRFREASNDAAGLTAQGLRFRDKMAGAMTGALTKLGTQLAATFAVTRVISFFKSSIAQIENFEAAVSKLRGISRASGDEIQRLTKLARELAAASKFTATQVVEAQTELAKLGLTVPQIEGTTGAILQLATAADTGIANAAEIATQTMNSFNLTAAEMPRLVDIMARSFTSSALNIDRWNASFKSVGATANAVGASVEDTAAAISALVDAGIPAEKAGTDLRNIYIELAAGGKTWKQAMDEIKGSQDKVTTAVDLFGKRSGAAGIILSENAEKLDRLGDSYRNSAGAAAELEKAQLDNLRGDRLLMASAWEEFILQVEDGTGVVGKFTRSVTQGLTEVIKIISQADLANEKYFKRIDSATERGGFIGWIQEMVVLRDAMVETGVAGQTLEGQLKRLRKEQAEIQAQQDKDLARTGTANYRELERVTAQIVELEKQINEQKQASVKKAFEGLQIQRQTAEETANQEEGQRGILAKLQTELKLLRERRDTITEEEGGRNEIARINDRIAAKQAEIDALLGRGVKRVEEKVKAVKELNDEWTKNAAILIGIEDDQEKRNKIVGGKESEVDKLLNDAIQIELDKGVEAYRLAQEQKTLIAQQQTEARKELEAAAISYVTDLGNMLLDGARDRSDRRLEIELDLLEKMRQNNEISQEEYERVTTESRRRQFEEMKRMRIAEAAINMASSILTILSQQGLPAGLPAIALATATGIAQSALISAQQFAKGGKVQDLPDGRINVGQNIPTQRNGDNVLATVKKGEVILNDRQQAALGGAQTFKQIGVPGFASGGLVAPQPRTQLGSAPNRIDYDKLAGAMSQLRIETSIVEIMGAINNQNRISELKSL